MARASRVALPPLLSLAAVAAWLGARALPSQGVHPQGAQSARSVVPSTAVTQAQLAAAAARGAPEDVRWLARVAAEHPRLGLQAAVALGEVRAPGAGEALREALLGSGPEAVRAHAARALGQVGGTSGAAALADVAAQEGEPLRVRQEAALALARVGTAEQVPQLAVALEESAGGHGPEAEQLRISLVEALAGIGSPRALAALQRHRGRALSPLERAFTTRALSRTR